MSQHTSQADYIRQHTTQKFDNAEYFTFICFILHVILLGIFYLSCHYKMYRNQRSYAGRSRLRSADHGDLIVPRVQTQHYSSRSFRVSGPTIWNSLPQNLRSSDISRKQFKRGLKTWLFERAYVYFLLKTRYINSPNPTHMITDQ